MNAGLLVCYVLLLRFQMLHGGVYGYITRAANELKDEIAKMKLANQTPMEFGLKVRQDPNSLIATARNKMRSATQVSRPVTVSGKLLETPKLKANPEILKAVQKYGVGFAEYLAAPKRSRKRYKSFGTDS